MTKVLFLFVTLSNVTLNAERRPECITWDSFYIEYMLFSFVGVHDIGKKSTKMYMIQPLTAVFTNITRNTFLMDLYNNI